MFIRLGNKMTNVSNMLSLFQKNIIYSHFLKVYLSMFF
jgi:hypothetical protein